jgi:hypothetical protein
MRWAGHVGGMGKTRMQKTFICKTVEQEQDYDVLRCDAVSTGRNLLLPPSCVLLPTKNWCLHGVTSQKTVISIFKAVRTSNLTIQRDIFITDLEVYVRIIIKWILET